MRKIVTVDCETDPFKMGRHPKPFIWGFFDGEDFRTYKTAEQIKKVLEKENFVVYAHNGGKFDYFYLTPFINTHENIMVINGRIAKMNIGSCEFRDSYNLIPLPLAAYQKTKIDYDIMEENERDKKENSEEIRKYLKDDCVYLHELVTSFINNYGNNLTLAGAAFKQWRKISGEKAPKTTKNFYNDIFKFYYGGRVQCFYMGEFSNNFQIYDRISAYPFEMRRFHPYGDNFSIGSKIPTKEIELSFINLTCKSTGAFPYRTKEGLYFPNDGLIREFNITGYEFLMALKYQLVKNEKILSVYTFPEKIEFNQYVNHFFKLKDNADKRGDKILRNEAKLFLNGLYGKFAANPDHYHEYMLIDPKFINASENIDGYKFNSMLGNWALVRRPLPETKHHYYNVATAASITGAQRAAMLEAIMSVRTPLYCDTDSIACADKGTLNIGNQLGDWKLEKECDYGAIAGKKLYAFRDKENASYKIASKGVRLKSADIIRIAKGEEISATNEAPTFSLQKDPYFLTRKILMKKDLQNIH